MPTPSLSINTLGVDNIQAAESGQSVTINSPIVANNGICLAGGTTIQAGAAAISQNGNLIPQLENISWQQGGGTLTSVILAPMIQSGESWQIQSIVARVPVTATGADAGLQVEVLPPGTAPGLGISQMVVATGTINLNSTTNSNIVGTLIAAPTGITQGSAIGIRLTGTLTNLAGLSLNIALKRIG